MFKKTLFLVVVLAAVSSTFAQGTKFGLRAGLNLASLKIDSKNVPEFDNAYGFHVGAIADISITDLFYVQPGLFFSAKGAWLEGDNKNYTDLYYLEIPLLASARVAINESLALRINAGPYAGFGISGTVETLDVNGSRLDDAFKEGYFKKLDFGIALGGGIEFHSFYLGVNYDLGLANVADTEKVDAYNRCLGITLGYNF